MRTLNILLVLILTLSSSLQAQSSRNFVASNTHFIDVGTFDLSGDTLTLMVWFNTNAINICGPRLISKSDGSAANDHLWMINVCNDDIRSRIRFGGTTVTLLATLNNITTNTWFHGAVVYDGANIILYVDGVNVASVGQTGNFDTDGTIAVSVGKNGSESSTGNNFDGELVDARIYDRALSPAEIVEAMNCINKPQGSLVMHLTLLGNDFTDISGSGNDGTNNGSSADPSSPGLSWCGGNQ